MIADLEGMARLGIDPESTIGALVSECGFEVFVRDDGINHSDYPGRCAEDYDNYLRAHGMDGITLGKNGQTVQSATTVLRTGWLLKNAPLRACSQRTF